MSDRADHEGPGRDGAAFLSARAPNGRQRSWVIALGVLGAAVGSTIAIRPEPLLVWNVSASAPIGLYAVMYRSPLQAGDMAIARVPERFRRLAGERRYVPVNVPLVKRVAGVPGDSACAFGPAIYVNGVRVAERVAFDGQERAMPAWHGCRLLGAGTYFLLNDDPHSFDGRYFGATAGTDILGSAVPLWTR